MSWFLDQMTKDIIEEIDNQIWFEITGVRRKKKRRRRHEWVLREYNCLR